MRGSEREKGEGMKEGGRGGGNNVSVYIASTDITSHHSYHGANSNSFLSKSSTIERSAGIPLDAN